MAVKDKLVVRVAPRFDRKEMPGDGEEPETTEAGAKETTTKSLFSAYVHTVPGDGLAFIPGISDARPTPSSGERRGSFDERSSSDRPHRGTDAEGRRFRSNGSEGRGFRPNGAEGRRFRTDDRNESEGRRFGSNNNEGRRFGSNDRSGGRRFGDDGSNMRRGPRQPRRSDDEDLD
jgi:hypothetical protein